MDAPKSATNATEKAAPVILIRFESSMAGARRVLSSSERTRMATYGCVLKAVGAR
jgi:hypothetical protein